MYPAITVPPPRAAKGEIYATAAHESGAAPLLLLHVSGMVVVHGFSCLQCGPELPAFPLPMTLHTIHWLPVGIFLATYILIAIESNLGSYLDRTAAAFCGAVVMVLA